MATPEAPIFAYMCRLSCCLTGEGHSQRTPILRTHGCTCAYWRAGSYICMYICPRNKIAGLMLKVMAFQAIPSFNT